MQLQTCESVNDMVSPLASQQTIAKLMLIHMYAHCIMHGKWVVWYSSLTQCISTFHLVFVCCRQMTLMTMMCTGIVEWKSCLSMHSGCSSSRCAYPWCLPVQLSINCTVAWTGSVCVPADLHACPFACSHLTGISSTGCSCQILCQTQFENYVCM